MFAGSLYNLTELEAKMYNWTKESILKKEMGSNSA